jgi:Uma2 family endonuclease
VSTAALKLGPADHGRPLSLGDYEAADYEPGFKYEIIDGRLAVAPLPNLPENRLERWLGRKLDRYADRHPGVINFVTEKPRVFVPGRVGSTVPEPDIACYHDFPTDADPDTVGWEDVSPVLVCEVLVDGDPDKDLVRNVDLYFEVPSVKEYWVLDGRAGTARPTLIQHRRYGRRWVVREYPSGSTFATKLLPGFALPIDPRK